MREAKKRSTTYMKISSDQKRYLLKRVFVDNLPVREVTIELTKVAYQMKMNLSTAKTILFLHRRKLKLRNFKPKEDLSTNSLLRPNQAIYRRGRQRVEIASTIGGDITYGASKVCKIRDWAYGDKPITIQW